MKSSEKRMRKNVVEILAPLDGKPVENRAWTGFPDVSYIEGVIELKQADRWPAREATPLKLDHFTNEQRIFLERRWRKGGNAYLLIQVNKTFLLYDGSDVQQIGRTLNQAQLREKALKVWEGLPALRKDLTEWLHRGQTSEPR